MSGKSAAEPHEGSGQVPFFWGRPTRRQLLSGAAVGSGSLLAVSGLLNAWGDEEHDDDRGRGTEAKNMRLRAHEELQGRSAYQPVIHRHAGEDGNRWIAYIGHHGGLALNPLTDQPEPNGTSIVDVTEPRRPRYLAHIPGEPVNPARMGESGGAQMVRVCNGSDLPNANPEKIYLLRSFGNSAHQIYDVTDPGAPRFVLTIVDRLTDTHKSWWEHDTGIAYLVCGDPEWRTNRMTKIYDLSDPEAPTHIRDFGLPGQEPNATVKPVPPALHGPIRLGDRVYFAYGTNANGVIQIVDRTKLLDGDPRPTVENLLAPQVGRLDMAPNWGAHTTFPVLGVDIPDFAKNLSGKKRDFLVVPSESLANECREFRHMTFIVDITTESRPFSVANHQVPEASGNFCDRGGRFGPHATNESFTDIYYKKLVFISYFNAGVRVVDIRDPFTPKEVAHFIPAVTSRTDKRCVTVDGQQRCKVAIQTNNVEVDDRGFVYIVDRANTGLHILELTGSAREIAGLPPDD